ncbi:MAG: hypothetical protein J6B01_04620 [Ruminococcus sp.]|nr:hypothetical protein [Ruminococcus sp.]
MFERIKCYKRLLRMDKINRGFVKAGETIHSKEMIQNANEALELSAIIKKRILFDRKMAKKYNIEFEKHGFK